MNIASLDNFLSNGVGSIFCNAIQGATSTNNNSSTSAGAITSGQSSDSSQLSPLAQILSTLQQVQQSDPAKYQQLTQLIATNLQNAAQTAQQCGNSTQANHLNQLATDFTNASSSGDLPNIKDLAAAIDGNTDSSSGSADSTNGAASTGGSRAVQQQLQESFLSIQINFSEITGNNAVQAGGTSSGVGSSGGSQPVQQQPQESLLEIQINFSEISISNATPGAVSAANSSANIVGGSGSGLTSDSSQLSPLAQLLNTLGHVQQSDLQTYTQLSSLVATTLQNEVQVAQYSGNSAEANQLNQLAANFTNASNAGGQPSANGVGNAAVSGPTGGGSHHHHHHHLDAEAGDYSNGGSSVGSGTTSGVSSIGASQATQQQMPEGLLAYQINFSESSSNGGTATQEAFSLSGTFASIG